MAKKRRYAQLIAGRTRHTRLMPPTGDGSAPRYLQGGFTMIQMVTILISVVSLVISFIFHPAWAWIPILLVDCVIYIQLWAAKQKYRFKYIPGLSPEANELLQRYGHYFAMPFASKDFSASAATSQFAGVLIAIIGVFKSFWWSIVLGAGNWFIMGYIAVSLSPVALLKSQPTLQIAHDEVVDFINSQRE